MPVVLVLLIALGAVGLFLALPGRGVTFARAGIILLLAALAGALGFLLPQFLPGTGRGWFAVLSLIGVLAAVRVITHPRPVYSALYFILVVVATAGLLVVMQATFLAAALVIIYAGAILVTYLFVIMLAQQGSQAAPYDARAREPFWGVLAGFIVLAVLSGRILAEGEPSAPAQAAAPLAGSPEMVGKLLLTEYVVAMQVAGVLLLAAMVGAVAIARRQAWQREGELPAEALGQPAPGEAGAAPAEGAY